MQFQNKILTVKIKISPKILQIKVPACWTVNKLKCMVIEKLSIYKFDNIDLLWEGRKMKGQAPLKQYLFQDEKNLTLTLTKASNQGDFEKFYSKQMNNFFLFLDYEDQSFNHSTKQLSSSIPLGNQLYKQAYLSTFNLKYKKANNRQENNQNDEGQVWLRLFNVLQIIGLYLTVQLLISNGSFKQIAAILVVLGAYYFIERQVRRNEQQRVIRNNQANNNAPQQRQINKEENKQQEKNLKEGTQIEQNEQEHLKKQNENKPIKVQKSQFGSIYAKIIINLCFCMEFLYCYFLSLFPNWTIQTHFQMNRNLINDVAKKVQQLDQSQKGKFKTE